MMGTDGRHAAESTWLLKTKKVEAGAVFTDLGSEGRNRCLFAQCGGLGYMGLCAQAGRDLWLSYGWEESEKRPVLELI